MTLAAYMSETGKTDAQIAAAMGVNAESVRLWRHGLRRISAERAIELSKVTGIPRHELRPDLWDPPTPTLAGAAPAEPERAPKRRRKRAAAVPPEPAPTPREEAA